MKAIYQLYDEWFVRHQMCLLCKFQIIGPVQGPQEQYKPPTGSHGETMEEHITKFHPKEVKK